MDNKEKEIIAKKLGEFLSNLHNFSLSKAKEIGINSGWKLKDREKEFNKRKKFIFSVLSSEEKKCVIEYHKKFFSLKVPDREYLIHDDLTDDHILINKDKLSGIIDFGDLSLGDPANDFAYLWALSEGFVNLVYKNYKGPKDNTFLLRAEYYRYQITMSYIYHGVEKNDKKLLNQGLKDIKELMRINSNLRNSSL